MEIKGTNYRINYDPSTAVVVFEGILRLSGAQDAQPIEDLLQKALQAETKVITLDVRNLGFL